MKLYHYQALGAGLTQEYWESGEWSGWELAALDALEDLLAVLKRPGQPRDRVLVLALSQPAELGWLIERKEWLEGQYVIMVLPEGATEPFARVHDLAPRLVFYGPPRRRDLESLLAKVGRRFGPGRPGWLERAGQGREMAPPWGSGKGDADDQGSL